jgi:uncharacterized membrane protein YphA (DoxX/SURF4 family)
MDFLIMKLANSTDCSQRRIIAYWVTTVIIAAEFAVGGVMDILRLPPFFEILRHLGYPGYFSVILGCWKVLGAVAVLAPRFSRLKEWAYAGMFFNMTGAAASHLAVGDPPVTLVAPIIFTGLVIASWVLRPSGRRDQLAASCASSPRSRSIAYWITTGLLALECGVGGVMGALRLPPFSEIMSHLGYPAYFMTIIGLWYMLAAVAILAPRFPRLKEWTYAGLVFVYTGAAASRLAVGDPAVTLVGPIIFTALVAASWALRPLARRVLVSRRGDNQRYIYMDTFFLRK